MYFAALYNKHFSTQKKNIQLKSQGILTYFLLYFIKISYWISLKFLKNKY